MVWNKESRKIFIKKINKLDKAKYPKSTKGIMATAVNNSPTMDAAIEKVAKEIPQYLEKFREILGVDENE